MKNSRPSKQPSFPPWAGFICLAVLLAALTGAAHPVAAGSMDPGGPGFLHLRTGLELEYNDNLFFTRNDAEEDLITTGSFGVETGYKSERVEINLKPQWRYYKYVDNTDLDDNDQLYRASLGWQATPRLTFSSEGAFIIDNRRDDQVTETGVVFENVERTRWEAQMAADYKLTELAAVNLFGRYENDDYEDRQQRSGFSDLETKGGGLGYTHLLPVFHRPTYFRLNAGYFNFDYDTAETDYYYLTVGASAEISEKYAIVVEGGPRYTDSDYDVARRENGRVVIEQDDSRNWGGNGLISLVYTGEKTNWELALNRDVTASSGATQTVERTELKLDLNNRWTWEWSTHLLLRYFYRTSDRDNSEAGDIDEDTLVFQPRVRYRINNDWFVQGLYRYTWRDDSDIDETWDRSQVLLQVGWNWKILE